MTLPALGIIVGGIATGVTSWGLTRANRLTFGVGAAHTLLGILLVVSGILWNALPDRTNAPVPSPAGSIVLLVVLFGLLSFVIRRALARSAAIMRWRTAVSDTALQSPRKPS